MMTAEEYRSSLRDGRKLFLGGVQVDDVVTHPAFCAAVENAAVDYDRYYDPAPGSFGPYFTIPNTADELRAQEELQHSWSFPTVSTSHALLMLMTAGSRMRADLPVYADRIMAYFESAKVRDIRCVQTITDAQGPPRPAARQAGRP